MSEEKGFYAVLPTLEARSPPKAAANNHTLIKNMDQYGSTPVWFQKKNRVGLLGRAEQKFYSG